MQVLFRKSAIKDLKNLPKPLQQKLLQSLRVLEDFPNLSNIKKLTNFTPAYRLRIGDYRVLFDVTEEGINVGRILHRQHSYQ